MLKCFKDEKFWCAVGGAAAVILGKKVVKAKKTKRACRYRSCKGNEAQRSDAQSALRSMKDEASDICYDAKVEAGIDDEEEVTE